MSAIERPSDEDIALLCILTDPSGVDLAEFAMADPEQSHGRFRLWDYQHPWFRCAEPRQVERGCRSAGKSLSILLRALVFPFAYPGAEMAITAPTLNHLTRVTGLVERRFRESRLCREILPKRASLGFTHKPFGVDFLNGSRLLGVLPQLDGSGVRGLHPLLLEVDELQDMPEPAFTELIETVKQGSDGATWRCHGVATGARDHFYKITQPDSGWKVHTMSAIMRPNWTDTERQQKIDSYGSRNDPDYRRNIHGDHGNSENPLFVLARMAKCVDMNDSSEYNKSIYTTTYIRAEQLQDFGGGIADMIPIPPSHKQGWDTFWLGVDVGLTQDPTEILVFGEREEKDVESSLTLLSRVNLTRIRHQDHTEAFAHMIMKYNAQVLAVDKTGLGLPIFQDMQDRFPSLAARVRGYNFSEKLIVALDQTIEIDPDLDDEIDKTKIVKNVLEHSSDVLRDLVDAGRLRLPNDDDVINSFKGETYSAQKKMTDLYGRRKFRNRSKSHILDAARMTAMAWSQAKIEPLLNKEEEEDDVILPVWA